MLECSGKSAKCEKKEASTVREEKKKHKNRDKDKDKESSDSHKSTEQTKEILVKDKELESTKESVKSNKDSSNSHKDREREKEKKEEKERETREREQKEKELRSSRELSEELKRVRAELCTAKSSEAEAKRALAAAAAAERARRADHLQLRQAHAQLQNKVSTWRSGERVALERRLSEERRARTNAEHQLLRARHANRTPNGECENEWCKSRRAAQEADTATLRRELQKARDRAAQLQKDLVQSTEQVTYCVRIAFIIISIFYCSSAVNFFPYKLATHRVASPAYVFSLISRQEKEIEELKAQMLAVMPTEIVTPVSNSVSKLRLSDGSPLDPNASVYTPKQLCSDA
ncbi:jg12248 [Pararge aegeria aegeria]|uniref:Jg12248 protein n=1 Tax=Pararge aegeria aegeria TaxID=348720 RepID=A0A8S4S8J8_9NEOP|nr:jg12248 [Pararge aegeria aegeria]